MVVWISARLLTFTHVSIDGFTAKWRLYFFYVVRNSFSFLSPTFVCSSETRMSIDEANKLTQDYLYHPPIPMHWQGPRSEQRKKKPLWRSLGKLSPNPTESIRCSITLGIWSTLQAGHFIRLWTGVRERDRWSMNRKPKKVGEYLGTMNRNYSKNEEGCLRFQTSQRKWRAFIGYPSWILCHFFKNRTSCIKKTKVHTYVIAGKRKDPQKKSKNFRIFS